MSEHVKADDLAALREMAATVGVKGKLLLQLLDEIEERRAAVQPNAETREAMQEARRKADQPDAAAVQDAVRYRWLRDLPDGHPCEWIGNAPGDMWDEAIDAGRAADQQGGAR
jgi:hypothetical protein